jgi:hypothetical protein
MIAARIKSADMPHSKFSVSLSGPGYRPLLRIPYFPDVSFDLYYRY